MSSNSILNNYADRLDANQRQAQFARIDASVRQLVQMLDDMLLISKMETGHLDFRPEMLNLGEFVQKMVNEFQAIHGDTHSFHFDNQIPDEIVGDPSLIRAIAANFLSNAIKYSPHGGEVWVTLEQADGYCVFRVRDQGIGITPEDQARLFQAFQRGSNVDRLPGTGLGLAIVKQAVELHSGTVHLESEVGVGTEVSVSFPLRRYPDHGTMRDGHNSHR